MGVSRSTQFVAFFRWLYCAGRTISPPAHLHIQIGLAEKVRLPMFLHMRDAHEDFVPTITANRGRITGGVVHSFDGSLDAAKALVCGRAHVVV